jgi:hypothetical protein
MTDDEVAYIEAKGWKASVVPELSIIHHFANFCGSNAGALRSAMPDADCGATRVRSDSSRNDLQLRSLDGAFSSPC